MYAFDFHNKLVMILFLLLLLIVSLPSRSTPLTTEKTPPDLIELVTQLRAAIVDRDVSGVKLYLNEIEGLGKIASPEPKLSQTRKSKRVQLQDLLKCKQELDTFRSLADASRKHSSQEVDKLKSVRKGVEQLLESLRGAQHNLLAAQKETNEKDLELATLHKQSEAAAKLQRDISDIQERARINYETGMVELDGGRLLEDRSEEEIANIKKNIAPPVDAAIMHADPKLLLDVVVLLGAAAVGGTCASAANMPHIIGYLLGGAFVGPSGWGMINGVVQVETLAQFGGVFFLFGHGLEFSLKEQRKLQSVSVGGTLLATALIAVGIQVSTLVSEIVSSPLEGALLGMSVSLSSLSVVLDYLRAHNLLQSTPAKVMTGMLGFQGFLVGLFFSIPQAFKNTRIGFASMEDSPPIDANDDQERNSSEIALSLMTSFGYATVTSMLFFAASKHILPRVFGSKFFSHDQDVYLLGAVSIAMFAALLTEALGLSLDLGAFLAGLMLSELDDGTHRTKKLIQPLASVFGAMLFASLGMMLNAEFFWKNLDEILIIGIQLVAIKAIVIWSVVRLFDFSFRTAIFCAVGMSHVGELSLLFSSKLRAYDLLSRRAYLLFLAATFATLAFAPFVLKLLASSRLATVDKSLGFAEDADPMTPEIGSPPSGASTVNGNLSATDAAHRRRRL